MSSIRSSTPCSRSTSASTEPASLAGKTVGAQASTTQANYVQDVYAKAGAEAARVGARLAMVRGSEAKVYTPSIDTTAAAIQTE